MFGNRDNANRPHRDEGKCGEVSGDTGQDCGVILTSTMGADAGISGERPE